MLVLNWWMFFSWHVRTTWYFEDFLVLVLWALSFYGMAIALFPLNTDQEIHVDNRYRWFAISLLATLGLDIIQTALLGTLFEPWYYLPFVGHYAVCAVVIAGTRKHAVTRALSWWLFLSVVSWTFIVRRSLGS